jgi:hypothetical protein
MHLYLELRYMSNIMYLLNIIPEFALEIWY